MKKKIIISLFLIVIIVLVIGTIIVIRNKKQTKIKVSKTNLNIQFLSGHLIKFNQTNLSITAPHRIIVKNSKQTLIALLHDNIDKIYLPRENMMMN